MISLCTKCEKEKSLANIYSYNNGLMCRACVIAEMETLEGPGLPKLKILEHLKKLEDGSAS